MRRKDSGSAGDDDASVKSVESVGKEEKKDSRKNEEPRERRDNSRENRERLRKTSSSELQDDASSARLKGIKEERKASEGPKQLKEKSEEKKSMDVQQPRKTSVEKEPQVKAGKQTRPNNTDGEHQRRKPGQPDQSAEMKNKPEKKEQDVEQTGRNDSRKRSEDLERRREGTEKRGGNENVRRQEPPNRKKDQPESKKESTERTKDSYENRKENAGRRSEFPDSKNERGSSESLRSKDGLDRRKEEGKRGEDAVKRKRDDLDRNEPLNEPRGNRGHNRDRLHAGRGRAPLGGKSSLRGHPKSYSHTRTDRSGSQRRLSQRTRNDSREEYPDEDVKRGVPAEEKRQVNDRGDERRGQSEADRRGRDPGRDSRPFGGDKRNERQSKEGKAYRGSGRLPSRNGQERPVDRAEKLRDRPKNSGGFGVPAPSKESKEAKGLKAKTQSEGSSKENVRVGGEVKPAVPQVKPGASQAKPVASQAKPVAFQAKPVASQVKPVVPASVANESKAEEKETKTVDTVGSVERNQVERPTRQEQPKDSAPPAINAWAKPEQKEKSNAVKTDVDGSRTVEKPAVLSSTTEANKEVDKKAAPASSAKDTRRDRKPVPKVGVDKQKRDTVGQRERVGSREKSGEQDTTKPDERRERTEYHGAPRRDQDSKNNRSMPKSDYRDSKMDETRRVEQQGELRRKTESKTSDERRGRTGPRDDSRREHEPKNNDRRPRWERGEDRRDQESKADGRRYQTGPREDSRQGHETRANDGRYRTEPRNESRGESRQQETKPEERINRKESTDESRRDQELKSEKRNEGTEQRSDSRVGQQTGNKSETRFTIGSTWNSERQGAGGGRYRESRRGGSALRRGGGRAPRGSRGRGRSFGSGRIPGKGSVTSKDEDDDSEDSDKLYLSATSSVENGSDESDDETFRKQDDGLKEGRGDGRSQPSGTRPSYSTSRGRGRGRGSSPLSSRNTRKNQERPPRFQKQEQARGAGRGRGKGRGQHSGFSSKDNLDDFRDPGKNYERSNKALDDGPLPKKRPPADPHDSSFSGEKGGGEYKNSRKSVRGGQGSKKNSFLAKKQQEVVEGSRKGSSKPSAGPKSTLSAASTHGRSERRTKNNDSALDLDDIPEPPKKNPRRSEPAKMGIDHIDLSNIAGFIDIDDIVQPTSETEPASPQSDFVEVKSKRTQKELRERAREEGERKKRELEKLMADAMLKPKAHKPNNHNKSHQTSKPPRFTRSNIASNQVPSVTRVATPPEAVPPQTMSPEGNAVCAVPSGIGEKRTSPLMMEKPSSPAPPPMFNAWTKPLSITPAKPQLASVEMTTTKPDPLAVGSGKPTRHSGAQPKSEEPELQLQVVLPDTFQAVPPERNMEPHSAGNADALVEDGEIKKRDLQAEISQNQKKEKQYPGASDSSINHEKNASVGEKRQGGNRNTRPPRFEKTTQAKRNGDGRKYKGDVKDNGSEGKLQSSTGGEEKGSKGVRL